MHEQELDEQPLGGGALQAAEPGGDALAGPAPAAHAPGWALLALCAYCLAYLGIRLLEQGALERDEAEIVYLTQHLRLGYGTQPPLYAWLQWGLFALFGVGRFGLVVLKDLALGASCIAMFLAARPLLGRAGPLGALAAAASLVLFPQVGWEALRIQTHSVLMTSLACATLALYFGLLRRPTLLRYACLGLLCGLGLQAKYNFGVFLAGMAGASLLVPAHRRILWRRGMWAAVLPALLLVLPHAAWMAAHPDLAFGATVSKMQDGMLQAAWPGRAAHGVLGVLSAIFSFLALPALVLAAACWRRRALWRGRLRFDAASADSRFFACMFGLFGVLLLALALTGEAGTVKERWLIPLLFCLPLGLFVMFPALGREAVYRDVLRASVLVALCLLALLPLRNWLGPAFGKLMSQHHPYEQLAQAVQRHCPQARTVFTESLLSAGNLRFARPALRTLLLEDAARERTPLAGPAALVAHAQDAPAALAAFRRLYPQARLERQGDLGLAIAGAGGRQMVFMVACVPGSPGSQRRGGPRPG